MSLVSEGADFRGRVDRRPELRLAEPSLASVGDYIALMKPRVMSLVVFTALVGPGGRARRAASDDRPSPRCSASRSAPAPPARSTCGTTPTSTRIMTRTARRPVPMGRVQPGEALAFGLTLAGFAVVMLGLLVNVLAAALLAFTIFFYVVIYTIWLKRSTPQNIVIGGAAGAFPPMIGWAAVTGSLVARADAAVPDHLLLDAAAFLGAGALPHRRLRARRHPDAAGGGRRRERRAGRSCATR